MGVAHSWFALDIDRKTLIFESGWRFVPKYSDRDKEFLILSEAEFEKKQEDFLLSAKYFKINRNFKLSIKNSKLHISLPKEIQGKYRKRNQFLLSITHNQIG